jgi:hypothetical protein
MRRRRLARLMRARASAVPARPLRRGQQSIRKERFAAHKVTPFVPVCGVTLCRLYAQRPAARAASTSARNARRSSAVARCHASRSASSASTPTARSAPNAPSTDPPDTSPVANAPDEPYVPPSLARGRALFRTVPSGSRSTGARSRSAPRPR